jgi:hypothetical protein
MFRIFVSLVVVGLIAVSSQSARADQGQISQAQLAEFGLGGMEMVSDSQGEQIRGKFLWNLGANTTYARTLAALQAIPNVGGTAATNFTNAVNAQNAAISSVFPGGIPYTTFGTGSYLIP